MANIYTFLKYGFICIWSIFVVAPFLWALSTSFKDFQSVTSGATYIPWLQFEPTTGTFCANPNLYIGRGQNPCPALRPLNQTDAVTAEIIPNAHVFQLLGMAEAVEVKMVNLTAGQLVRFHQGIGRTFNRA